MKTEISIRNGSGWNNYTALRELKSLPVGTGGLLKQNNVVRLEIGPTDRERPYGISARYFDRSGEEVFCQNFDQNDSAAWIRERVVNLLQEGIANRIAARRREISRDVFIKKIKSWRKQPAPIAPHRAEPKDHVYGKDIQHLRDCGVADATWRDVILNRQLIASGLVSISKGDMIRGMLINRVKSGLDAAVAIAAAPQIKLSGDRFKAIAAL